MEILIREIKRKGDSFIFRPNSRGGFRFTEDNALPRLTPFQYSCINTKPSKSRKSNGFWTPDFCFYGAYFASSQEINLSKLSQKEITNESDLITDFNSNFPEKKWYWYSKANSENLAVQMYFLGVRVVSSIVAHYLNLQLSGNIKKANTFYSKILQPTGLANILSLLDSELQPNDGNSQYDVEMKNGDYYVVNNALKPKNIAKEENSYLKEDTVLKESRKTTSNSRIDDKRPEREVGVTSSEKPAMSELEGKKIATPKDMKLPSITSKKDESSSNHDSNKRKGVLSPQRIKLPKRGDS